MGFSAENYPYQVKTGLISLSSKRADFQDGLLQALHQGHELFISNIFDSEYLRQYIEQFCDDNSQQQQQHLGNTVSHLDLDRCFIVSDLSFTKSQVGHISPYLNFWPQGAGELSKIVKTSKEALARLNILRTIVQYCGYLGVKCLTICLRSDTSRLMGQMLNEFSAVVQIEEDIYKARIGLVLYVKLEKEKAQDCWNEYVRFRNSLHPNIPVDLIVEFGADLPNKKVISKWMSEHIYFFSFSCDCFVTNNKGYPVLPVSHESLAVSLFKLKSSFLLSTISLDSQTINSKKDSYIPYFKYLSYVFSKMAKNSEKREIMARGLYQTLQHPLQPYADNLESETYSIFQFDTPKYDEYAVAILLALQKIQVKNRSVVVYYIGCGRGALIPGIIEASKKTHKKVTIYAIDKNPFPIQTLKRRVKENKWGSMVKIVQSDIKNYKFEQKPDIFFSELLGGFGDNELSPQCLKWAEEYYLFIYLYFSSISAEDKERLICIPQNYSSYIRPVCYPSIHRTLTQKQREGSYFTVNFGWHYSPFKSKEIWTFEHPIASETHLNKGNSLVFTVEQSVTVHGVMGSFDSKLYDSSYISIVPENPTIGMFSWFPIFFAFEQQEYLEKGETLEIQMSRINDEKQVWYEWKYSIFSDCSDCPKKQSRTLKKQSKTHNQNGKINKIFL